MKKFALLMCLALGIHACGISTQTLEDGTYALVVSGTAFTTDEQTALNNNTYESITISELWKTDTSTLVAEGIKSFAGKIRIKGGVYKVNDVSTAIGTSATSIWVEDGATFEITSGTPGSRKIHLAGEGYTGLGAYRATGGGFGSVIYLDADALVAPKNNWMTIGSTTFDMGGHCLSVEGVAGAANPEVVLPKNITNLGNFEVRRGTFTPVYNANRLEGTNHIITLKGGCIGVYASNNRHINWTIRVKANLSLSCSESGKNYYFEGPFEIDSGKTFTVGNPGNIYLGGNISGDGTLLTGKYTGSIVYLSGTNSVKSIYVQETAIVLETPEALPSIASDRIKFMAGYAALNLRMKTDKYEHGWTSAQLQGLLCASKANGCTFRALLDTGTELEMPENFTSDSLTCGAYLGAMGGTLKLTGGFDMQTVRFSSTSNASVQVTANELPRTANAIVSNIIINSGTVYLKDAGTITQPREIYLCSPLRSNPSRLILEGNTQITRALTSDKTKQLGGLFMSQSPSANDSSLYSIVEVRDGASLTNFPYLNASDAQSCATFRQMGGETFFGRFVNGNRDGYIGMSSGDAYVEINKGLFQTHTFMHLGAEASACGMVYQRGGTWKSGNGGNVQIGWSGQGCYYLTSGLFEATADVEINSSAYTKLNGKNSMMTLESTNAIASIWGKTLHLAGSANATATLNLLDGARLTVKDIQRELKSYLNVVLTNNIAYVNFNGGILRASTDKASLLGSGDTRPTRVIAYEKGAIVQVEDSKGVSINAPITAPEGKGIAKIDLPAKASDCTGFMLPPRIAITGDGTGATAVAIIDFDTQTLTGIRVTSPGWNYTTASVTLTRGSKASTWSATCPVTLADNVGGGLEKRGTGTLTLNAANTYAGETRLAGGTLALGAAENALPSTTTVVLAGGVLDVGTHTDEIPTKWAVDFAVATNGTPTYAGNLTFPTGATLSVLNVDTAYLATCKKSVTLLKVTGTLAGTPKLIAPELKNYQVEWRGKSLVLGRHTGACIIIR